MALVYVSCLAQPPGLGAWYEDSDVIRHGVLLSPDNSICHYFKCLGCYIAAVGSSICDDRRLCVVPEYLEARGGFGCPPVGPTRVSAGLDDVGRLCSSGVVLLECEVNGGSMKARGGFGCPPVGLTRASAGLDDVGCLGGSVPTPVPRLISFPALRHRTCEPRRRARNRRRHTRLASQRRQLAASRQPTAPLC